MAFPHLRVVTPYEPAYREARSAVGAAPVLAKAREEFESVAEAVADCRLVVGTRAVGHRELHRPLRRLEETYKDYSENARARDGAREGEREKAARGKVVSNRVALLFSYEKFWIDQ